MDDRLNPHTATSAALARVGGLDERCAAEGRYFVDCFDADGNLKWSDWFDNTVVTVGKNAMLGWLSASAFTQVGPFMGLISSVSFTAISATDTMTSHAGWLEAGATNAPTYTAPRKTCVFAAPSAGAVALTAALAYAITGSGTIKGAFITLSTGAVATIDNTAGVLFSAGLFAGGDRAVLSGDTVNVSYSLAL